MKQGILKYSPAEFLVGHLLADYTVRLLLVFLVLTMIQEEEHL